MQDFFDGLSASAGQPEGALAEVLRDYEYFSGIFPASLRGLRARVAEACDRLDYRGSLIYDEYPDRIAVEGICRKIAGEIEEEMRQPEQAPGEIPALSGRGGEEPFGEESREKRRGGEETQEEMHRDSGRKTEKGDRIVPFPEYGGGGLLRAASSEEDGRVETYEIRGDRYRCPAGHPYSGTIVMGNPGTYGSWQERGGRKTAGCGPAGDWEQGDSLYGFAEQKYMRPGFAGQAYERPGFEKAGDAVFGTERSEGGNSSELFGLHTMELGAEGEKGKTEESGREKKEEGVFSKETASEQVKAENLNRERFTGPGPVRPDNPGRPERPWGPPPPERPWGPPPPPERPWGPPPPPDRPWGPPPPPDRPWGPPPPPERPWGPPPPPERPWGPPPPRRPGGSGGVNVSDVVMLLLLGEIQHRRCLRRNCG